MSILYIHIKDHEIYIIGFALILNREQLNFSIVPNEKK